MKGKKTLGQEGVVRCRDGERRAEVGLQRQVGLTARVQEPLSSVQGELGRGVQEGGERLSLTHFSYKDSSVLGEIYFSKIPCDV